MKAEDKHLLDELKNTAINQDKRKSKHKCDNCPWGTWTGLSIKCALPRCMPKLGNFNGVDKNGQTEKIL